MKTVYVLYSNRDYESSLIKGIFLNKEDAESMANSFKPDSYDSLRIEEATTKYPHCDMYAVLCEGSHYFVTDSYKLAVEESKRILAVGNNSKVVSFAIRAK